MHHNRQVTAPEPRRIVGPAVWQEMDAALDLLRAMKYLWRDLDEVEHIRRV